MLMILVGIAITMSPSGGQVNNGAQGRTSEGSKDNLRRRKWRMCSWSPKDSCMHFRGLEKLGGSPNDSPG